MHCGFFDGKMIQVVSGPEGSLGGEEMPGKTFRDGSSLIEAVTTCYSHALNNNKLLLLLL